MSPLAVWLRRLPASAQAYPTTTGSILPAPGITIRADAGDVIGVGLSWEGPEPGGVVATVRPLVNGAWGAAIDVESDHGHGPPDPTGRVHSPAVLVPDATAFEITPNGTASHLRVVEIPDTRGPLSTFGITAEGYTTFDPMPGLSIIERSNWTDRMRRDTVDCWLGSSVNGLGCRADVGIRHAVVHHTVNINSYGPADVPRLLRGIQRYHMDTRGWDDIGYNFVIDRFGRIWHARAGSIEGSVSGAHTSGLNTESVGVAVLGTFSRTDPGQPVVDSLSTLLGWKLARYGVDPLGTTSVRSAGGDYAEPGEMVLVNNVSGHRENQQTSCPGSVLFGRIPEIRTAAAELSPVFGHLVPDYGPDAIGMSGWAIDRFAPTTLVPLTITTDQTTTEAINADAPHPDLSIQYPAAGDNHGFTHTVPIDLDTRSITVTASAGDGRTASLMDLRLFATFIDVEPTKFFADGVYWLRANDITKGTLPGLFEPMDEVSRIQMAAFLWRLWGQPAVLDPPPFEDVPPDHPLAPAVGWLAYMEITRGTSVGIFSPDEFVTRGQMAAFLWRMCGHPAPSQPSPFVDVTPGSFYFDAANWLQEVQVTQGTTADTYSPDLNITRGEMAVLLHRLAQSPAAWTAVAPPPLVEASLLAV